MKRTKPVSDPGDKKMTQEAAVLPKKGVPVVKPIDEIQEGEKGMKMLSRNTIIGVYIALILLGVGTGYLLTRSGGTAGAIPVIGESGKSVGSSDTTTFKDSAEGTIEKGGSGGEGTHALIREGGPSQTAYLISSVVDLDQYVGKKVKVWGQTMAAKKVSWLMDVGKIELQ